MMRIVFLGGDTRFYVRKKGRGGKSRRALMVASVARMRALGASLDVAQPPSGVSPPLASMHWRLIFAPDLLPDAVNRID